MASRTNSPESPSVDSSAARGTDRAGGERDNGPDAETADVETAAKPDIETAAKPDAKAAAKIGASKPRVPPPPTIGAPPVTGPRGKGNPLAAPRTKPTIRVQPRTLDSDDAPTDDAVRVVASTRAPPAAARVAEPMPDLAAGPRTLRPSTSKAAEVNDEPLELGDAEPDVDHGPGDADERETGARLPRPGMLRGDAQLEVKEFRRKAKPGPPPPPGAGVLPSAGMVPPAAAAGAPSKVVGADTDVLIAQVALEMIGVPDEEDEAGFVALSDAPTAQKPNPPVTGSPSPKAVPMKPAPLVAGPESGPDGFPTRPLLVAGAVLLTVVLWWGFSGADPPQIGASPKAAVASAPKGSRLQAKPKGQPVPKPIVAVAGGSTGGASGLGQTTDAMATGQVDGGSTGPAPGSSGSDGSESDGDSGTDGTSDAAPQPASAPRPRTKKPSKPPPPKPSVAEPTPSAAPTAAELLADARRAYSAGRSGEAYNLAKKSNSLKAGAGALETMALASCQRKDETSARGLLKKLPRARRGSVRERCRTYGVRLGV